MIFDGPGKKFFPNSCVKFVLFRKNHELQQTFAYLREKEDALQRDIAKLGNTEKLEEVRRILEMADAGRDDLRLLRRVIELWTIENQLRWMVTNVTGSPEERAERRRGWGSREHQRMAAQTVDWTESKLKQKLLSVLGRKKK